LKPAKGTWERYFGNEGRGQLPDDHLAFLLKEVKREEVMRQAWWRIVHTFAGARSGPARTSTRGYITGLDERPSELAAYIRRLMRPEARDEIFSKDNLPEGYEHYCKGSSIEVVERVVYELFMRVLIEMRAEHKIFRLGANWEILSSELADYHRLVERTIPNPGGRGDYRRGSRGSRLARPVSVTVRRELLAAG
jgi:hypothetical protein